MNECPTTQPISDAAQKTSPFLTPNIFCIAHERATACPPLSLRTPLGLPINGIQRIENRECIFIIKIIVRICLEDKIRCIDRQTDRLTYRSFPTYRGRTAGPLLAPGHTPQRWSQAAMRALAASPHREWGS